jgi:hypothetical protein
VLAQALADGGERRARMVGDLAGRIDLAAHVGDFAGEGDDGRDQTGQDRERSSQLAHGRARLLDRFEVVRQPEQPQRFERPSLDVEPVENVVEIGGRAQRESRMVGEKSRAFARRPLGGGDARRIRHRVQLGEPGLARRRYARPVTTETMRSNSRARRALACMAGMSKSTSRA